MLEVRAAIVLTLCLSCARAGDWPQWRGPNRDGVSPEVGLLKKWPAGGPPLLWTAKGAGRGYSSMAVAAGKIYTVGDAPSTENDKDEYLLCFDVSNGKPIWKAKLGLPYRHNNKQWESSRSTPTLDGDSLYVLTGNGDLVCLETLGGKERWRKNMQKDFGGKKGDGWGYSESVLIEDQMVICTPGGETTMAALDKRTGKTLWTAVLPKKPGAGHASIVIATVGRTRVCVQTTAGFGLGVRARDGRILWTLDKFNATAVIPTPIVRDDLVLLAAGYGRGGTLLRQVADDEGNVKVEEVYPLTRGLANKHGGIIRVGDYIYADTEDSGTPYCAEFLTGKLRWKHRGAGGSVSMVAADGYLYMHYANGTMALVKASPDEYKVVSSFKIPNSGDRPGWAHPIIAGGRLYLREGDFILCFDVRALTGRSMKSLFIGSCPWVSSLE
jgi:outer membrane protein assembly factor BamB